MHHPGPPRFTSVGESVELAPRAPDGDAAASFTWSLTERPDGSDATLGDNPVEHLHPDVPGLYRTTLDAPDGTHELTVRAFPDERQPVRFGVPAADLPETDDLWVTGAFNDHRLGIDTPTREDDCYSFETALLPGHHEAVFVPDGDFDAAARTVETVEGPDRPRVDLDATVEEGHVRFEATPLPSPGSDETAADLEIEFYVDDRDRPGMDGLLSVLGRSATYERAALPETLRVHAVAVGERYSVADSVTVHRDGTVEHPNDPPEWVRDATMYSAFTRSFTGDIDATFPEIERRVPYLEWLGIDALWLTPVLQAYSPQRDHDGFEYGGPHGYDTLDYFQVAPDLGSREEFVSLVETCHDHGIKVLFDLVVNHTSEHHRFFQFAQAGVEKYREYYRFRDNGEPEHYFAWSSIPNLNYDSLAVRAFVLDVVEEWAPLVDGFRCDVAWGVPHGFWKEVRERVKAQDSDFLLLDESIPREPEAHELEFDLHYDTTLYGTLLDIGRGDKPATALLDAVESEAREGFPPSALQLRYIENHDESRYVKECDRAAAEAATAAIFTLPGVPMLYYGQEVGMRSFRGAMEWGSDEALTDFYRRLSVSRDELPVLRRGSVEPVAFESNSEHVVAFARETDDQRVVVVLNFGDEPAAVTLPEGVGSTDLLSETGLAADGGTTLSVETVVVLDA